MFVRTISRIAAIVSLPVLGACSDITQQAPTTNRYAAVSIIGKGTSDTQARANATVIFFEALSLAVPNSSLSQSDECTFANVDTIPRVTQGERQVGPTVSLTSGTTNYQLAYASATRRYENAAAQPILYNAGDQATVTVSGEGGFFPAATIGVKFAEPLVVQPVALPAAGSPMAVRWNAINDNSSAIIVTLRYANPATSPFANEQILCSLRDDGSHDIPGAALTAFLASPANRRSLNVLRWRTNELQPSSSTLMHIVSSVDTTIAFP